MSSKELTYDALAIAQEDIYWQMGYHDATPDAQTRQETTALTDDVRRWLRPRFCYFVNSRLPEAFDIGQIIRRQLRGSEAYALFIATAGMEYEEYMQRLKNDGDMVRVFIADALGSVIAEKCADTLEQHLQQSIDKLGWRHTNRFSPGYCGWHVSQQQILFPLFTRQTASGNQQHLKPGNPCGVRLTDSSLMVPIKSVSGIIGLGKDVRRMDYSCSLCDYAKCYKRRANGGKTPH